MFDVFPEWLQIFFLSMIPWLESRYVIPLSMVNFGWEWWHAVPIAITGNMLPIPFILLFFKYVEKFLRRYPFWSHVMTWLFIRTRKKADIKIRNYEYLGLVLFVAIPLPFTGAWTGALIAYLFDLDFYRSLLTILVGVGIAATVMVFFTLTGQYLWFTFNG